MECIEFENPGDLRPLLGVDFDKTSPVTANVAIATEEGELPAGFERETVLDAAVGLTRYEAEAAFSLSLVREGRVTSETLWEQKAQLLKKSGLLTLHRGGESFAGLGGLAALKAFTKRALLQPSRDNPLKRPRGVLLLSPPGCGKSQFCKSLGREVGRPVLILDVGSLLSSLVGQSEERTRHIVGGVEPQSLRSNQVLRQSVAEELSGVQSVLDDLLVDRPRRNIIRRPR